MASHIPEETGPPEELAVLSIVAGNREEKTGAGSKGMRRGVESHINL